jgi:hypothetical protein
MMIEASTCSAARCGETASLRAQEAVDDPRLAPHLGGDPARLVREVRAPRPRGTNDRGGASAARTACRAGGEKSASARAGRSGRTTKPGPPSRGRTGRGRRSPAGGPRAGTAVERGERRVEVAVHEEAQHPGTAKPCDALRSPRRASRRGRAAHGPVSKWPSKAASLAGWCSATIVRLRVAGDELADVRGEATISARPKPRLAIASWRFRSR